MTIEAVKAEILAIDSGRTVSPARARKAFTALLEVLDAGTVRAAEKIGGVWRVNEWVKKGILLGFRIGKLKRVPGAGPMALFDKETLPLKRLSLSSGVRVVPGGTSIRRGSFVAPSVIVMPPAFINIGAYVGAGSMIDSHALVGSCAQVGERVHLSAASQLGGVLEPMGAMPVIVEDDVLIGGNCGIYEGTIIGRRAVIATGVTLTASMPVFDLVNGTVIRRDSSGVLRIPERAVVVAGSRSADAPFARTHGIQVYAPVIIKYRDESTDARTALEESLRTN